MEKNFNIHRKEFYGKYGTSAGIKGKRIKETICGTKVTGDGVCAGKNGGARKETHRKNGCGKGEDKKKKHICITLAFT